jgi:3-oxoacyl-[acyl-carrier-protein] synthase II
MLTSTDITTTSSAVTAMAWTTPLGNSLAGVWELLLAGKTGLRPVSYAAGRFRNDLAGAVTGPYAELEPRERLHRMTCDTLAEALRSAGRQPSDADIRLVIGTSLGTFLEDSPHRSTYQWAALAAKDAGLVHAPIAISTACSSGSDAILLGAELIRSGQTRCCICGGADVLTWSKRAGHSALGTMSPTTLRAFDRRHDGTLLGEGAGFLVLEANDTAGASKRTEQANHPLAFLRGIGSANDATGMTAADTSGLSARYAIERSLRDAQLPASAIGLINAHGSGTQMNDTTEKRALGELFMTEPRPLVFATKGNFGHTLGATGTLEAIALIMAMRNSQVPPIYGLEEPDPEFALPLARTAVHHSAQFGLSLTLGFGGFDTSLIFEVAA